MKKIDYLYKDKQNANVYSNYLLEKVNKDKDKEKINFDQSNIENNDMDE